MKTRDNRHPDNQPLLVSATYSSVALRPAERAARLANWFDLYLHVEVGHASASTFKAKKADLQKFLAYLQEAIASDHPDQWTKALTEGFLKRLRRADGLSPATVNRQLATLKHVAWWIHRQRPFLVGNPCINVRGLDEDEPVWQGLTELQINRLRSAAEQLVHISKRCQQRPLRNYAIFLTLLHTGVRQCELLSLD